MIVCVTAIWVDTQSHRQRNTTQFTEVIMIEK